MSTESMTPKDRVLKFLNGEKVDRPPVFSGMGNVIKPMLDKYKIPFNLAHRDPVMMAKAAAGMYHEYGFECAVVPFDLGVEAEALGSKMNFYDDVDSLLYPTIKEKCITGPDDIKVPADISKAGRIPVVMEAIRILKKELGDKVAIGTYILGPFTLAGQMQELDTLLEESFVDPEKTHKTLSILSDYIVEVFKLYQQAGADYFTLREMGATSDVMSPRSFKSLVKPHLIKIHAAMPRPNILHICGDTNNIIEDMAECGANAVSVDHKNRVPDSRKKVGEKVIIMSGFDPVKILHQGAKDGVRPGLEKMWDGADAVWPGCDIWPEVPKENMEELTTALKDK
ncbi:MAG: methyltransferase [Nitrospinota bacterium]|nr:methyltransferase [Nitrospinota bacterium]MDH4183316.1 methyltransferase [Nitrospinota bacterium]